MPIQNSNANPTQLPSETLRQSERWKYKEKPNFPSILGLNRKRKFISANNKDLENGHSTVSDVFEPHQEEVIINNKFCKHIGTQSEKECEKIEKTLEGIQFTFSKLCVIVIKILIEKFS